MRVSLSSKSMAIKGDSHVCVVAVEDDQDPDASESVPPPASSPLIGSGAGTVAFSSSCGSRKVVRLYYFKISSATQTVSTSLDRIQKALVCLESARSVTSGSIDVCARNILGCLRAIQSNFGAEIREIYVFVEEQMCWSVLV